MIIAIDKLLPATAETKESKEKAIDRKKLQAVCQSLEQQLAISSMSCLSILEDNSELLKIAFGDDLLTLQWDIDNFDFAKALEHLQALMLKHASLFEP